MKFLRRTRHVASIVILSVAFGCALSSNADQSQPNDEQQKTGNLQPAAIAPATGPQQPPTGTDQQPTRNRWEVFLDRLADPVTWFTGGLLWLAVRQYRAMRRQADYMREGLTETRKAANAAEASATFAVAQKRIGDRQLEQMQAALDVSRINANAAAKSADVAEQSLRLTQRADVLVDGYHMFDRARNEIRVPTPDAMIELIVKNFGATRAKNLIITEMRLELGSRQPKNPGTLPPPLALASQGTILPCFAPLERWFDRSLIATIGDPGDGNQLRYIIAFTYTDAFDDTHTVRAIGRYMAVSQAFSVEHNHAD